MTLVFLYGQPGVGKLTVGRELAALTGMALFHNHLVVDAVGAVFPFGSMRFVALRERFWLDVMQGALEEGRSLVFTFAPEGTVDPGFPHRVRDVAKALGAPCHFVRLLVSEAEQDRRVDAADRSHFGKLTSLPMLRSLRPGFDDAMAAMPEPGLSLDTSAMAPKTAALEIQRAFGL